MLWSQQGILPIYRTMGGYYVFPEDVEISPREARLTERERQVLSYLELAWETRYMQDAGNFRGMVLQDSELETGLLSGVHQSRHSAKSWFRFCA